VAEFTIWLVAVVVPPKVAEAHSLVLVVLGVVEPLETLLVAVREHLAHQTLVAAAVQAIPQLAATAVLEL